MGGWVEMEGPSTLALIQYSYKWSMITQAFDISASDLIYSMHYISSNEIEITKKKIYTLVGCISSLHINSRPAIVHSRNLKSESTVGIFALPLQGSLVD